MKSRLLHFIYAFLPFLPFVSVFFQVFTFVSSSRHLTFFCSFFPLSFLFPFLPFLLFLFLRLLILIFPSFPPYHRSLLTLLFQCICILLLLRFPLTITAPFRSISVIHSYLSLSLSLSPFPVHSFTDIFLLHFFIHLHSFLLVDFYPGRCTGAYSPYTGGLLLLLSLLPESLDFFKLPLSRERNRHSLIFSPGTTSGFKELNGFTLNILTG